MLFHSEQELIEKINILLVEYVKHYKEEPLLHGGRFRVAMEVDDRGDLDASNLVIHIKDMISKSPHSLGFRFRVLDTFRKPEEQVIMTFKYRKEKFGFILELHNWPSKPE